MSREVIHFYSVQDEYGCFSNFPLYPIKLKKKVWPTSEHYYQAQKHAGTPLEGKIRKASHPGEAAALGRDRKNKIRPDWDKVRVSVMKDAVRAKFTQHPELAEILLFTGDAKIVEHTERDDFWGDGGDGKGQNMLGRILMEVREELRRERES